MKPKVLFLHILKCGGTSLKYMLYEEYGVELWHPEPVSTLTTLVGYPVLRGIDALSWQAQLNVDTAQHYGCIAGHYDWGLAERLPDWDVIVMLRDPVEQLRSLYQYMCASQHEIGEVATWMRSIGFYGWLKSNQVKPYLNLQTAYLSGHRVRSLVHALDNLMSERVTFGMVESYGESIRRFNAKFGWSMRVQHRMKNDPFEMSDAARSLAVHLQRDDMFLWVHAVKTFYHDQVEAS